MLAWEWVGLGAAGAAIVSCDAVDELMREILCAAAGASGDVRVGASGRGQRNALTLTTDHCYYPTSMEQASIIILLLLVDRVVTTQLDGLAILVNDLEGATQLELLPEAAPCLVKTAP